MWLWTLFYFSFFSIAQFCYAFFWKHFSCPDDGIIMNSSRATNQQRRVKKSWFSGLGANDKAEVRICCLCLTLSLYLCPCVSEICLHSEERTHAHLEAWVWLSCCCSYVISSAAAAHRINWSKCRFLEVCHKTKDKVAVACHMPHAARRMLMHKVLTQA